MCAWVASNPIIPPPTHNFIMRREMMVMLMMMVMVEMMEMVVVMLIGSNTIILPPTHNFTMMIMTRVMKIAAYGDGDGDGSNPIILPLEHNFVSLYPLSLASSIQIAMGEPKSSPLRLPRFNEARRKLPSASFLSNTQIHKYRKSAQKQVHKYK